MAENKSGAQPMSESVVEPRSVVTYDAVSDTIKGDKLFLFITTSAGVLPVAFGTSCNIDLSADTIDISSQMSGNWKESLVGQLGYTVSSDSLMSMKTGHVSFNTLKKLMAAREPIPFIIGKATTGYAKGDEVVKGNAIITSLSMKADNGSIVTSSVSLQGTGELQDGAPAVPA